MKKKIVFVEIIIIIAILLGLILPNIIGTTKVEVKNGFIENINSINGHNVGITSSKEKELANVYFPDSKQIEYKAIEDGKKAIINKEIDALVCELDDAKTITKDSDDLVFYQQYLIENKDEVKEGNKLLYLVVRKEDCAFRTTNKTIEDILKPGIKFACLTGLDEAKWLKEMNPDCTIEYYDSFVDVFAALDNGKADYCFGYSDNIQELLPSFTNIAAIAEPFAMMNECFAVSKTEKGNKITEEFDDFLNNLQKSGRYKEIDNKWKSGNEDIMVLEETNYTGENGVLKISTPSTWYPNTFIKNNEVCGVLIDICNLFCEEKGYIPEYYITNFAGEIAGLSSGEYDLMADLCQDTEERRKTVNFTRPAFVQYSMIYTLGEKASYKEVSKLSIFIDSMKDKFNKNFIEEDRYQMIIYGLSNTIKISILSAIIGTLLGALICAMRMSDKSFLNAFARIYIKVVQGTPIVVMLLILYYLVFANSGVSGFWVSVFGFTIDFSAYAAEIFRSGIESIPEGQAIAARALGFSSLQAFIKVVLPQALINIVPVYSGQFISLVKTTSVVGYIAVQDLTKVSDLIRSTTYEAFFPLISTAIMYFVISTLLIQILNIVTKKIDPLKRSRIPKGVKTNVI